MGIHARANGALFLRLGPRLFTFGTQIYRTLRGVCEYARALVDLMEADLGSRKQALAVAATKIQVLVCDELLGSRQERLESLRHILE
jgi:hypothetical protein